MCALIVEASSWTSRRSLCYLLLYPALAYNQSPSRIPVVVVLTTGRNVASPRRPVSTINHHPHTGHGRATTKQFLDSVITIKIHQLCSHPQGFEEPDCWKANQLTRLSSCMPLYYRTNKRASTFQWITTMVNSRKMKRSGFRTRQQGGQQSLGRWPVP